MVPLQAMISESLRRRTRVVAAAQGREPRDVVADALRGYLPGAEKEIETTLVGDRKGN